MLDHLVPVVGAVVVGVHSLALVVLEAEGGLHREYCPVNIN